MFIDLTDVVFHMLKKCKKDILVCFLLTGLATFSCWMQKYYYDALVGSHYAIFEKEEYYRFLTCGFVHWNFSHFFVTMGVFVIFGQVLLQNHLIGKIVFFVTYLLGMFLGNYMSYVFGSLDYVTAGSVGGVATVVAISLIYGSHKIFWFFIPLLVGVLLFFSSVIPFFCETINVVQCITGLVLGLLLLFCIVLIC